MCLRTAWRLVWPCVADRDSRVWAAEARPHGTSEGFWISFSIFQTQIGKQQAFTLLLKASVLRANSRREGRRQEGAGEWLHCSIRPGSSSPQVTAWHLAMGSDFRFLSGCEFHSVVLVSSTAWFWNVIVFLPTIFCIPPVSPLEPCTLFTDYPGLPCSHLIAPSSSQPQPFPSTCLSVSCWRGLNPAACLKRSLMDSISLAVIITVYNSFLIPG